MFQDHCTACDRDELIFPSMVTSLRNTDAGIEIGYECWCGAAQTWRSGRAAETRPTVTLAA